MKRKFSYSHILARARLFCIGVGLAAALDCAAKLVTFEFQGTITEVIRTGLAADPPFNLLEDWGGPGEPFWGTVTYDVDSPFFRLGHYSYDPSREENLPDEVGLIALNLQTSLAHTGGSQGGFAQLPSRGDPVFADLVNSPGRDYFRIEGEYGPSWFITFYLEDLTGTALSDVTFPSDLALEDWTSAGFFAYVLGAGNVYGTITSLQRVPETGHGALLLSLAIASLLCFRRRFGLWKSNVAPARPRQ